MLIVTKEMYTQNHIALSKLMLLHCKVLNRVVSESSIVYFRTFLSIQDWIWWSYIIIVAIASYCYCGMGPINVVVIIKGFVVALPGLSSLNHPLWKRQIMVSNTSVVYSIIERYLSFMSGQTYHDGQVKRIKDMTIYSSILFNFVLLVLIQLHTYKTGTLLYVSAIST